MDAVDMECKDVIFLFVEIQSMYKMYKMYKASVVVSFIVFCKVRFGIPL